MKKLFTSTSGLVLGVSFLAFLAFTTTTAFGQCDAKFKEKNGLIVFEAEEATLVQDWEEQTTIGNFTGSGYIIWTGPKNLSNPGVGVLDYVFEIDNPGTYRFEMRSQIDNQGNPNVEKDARNDSFVRFPDADEVYAADGVDGSKYYPKGSNQNPTIPGAGNENWVKVFMGQFEWTWGTNSGDELSLDLYATFDNPGVYTMQISSRSTFHAVDRFILYKVAGGGGNIVSPNNARKLSNDQSLCSGGGNNAPNVSITDPDDNDVFLVGNNIQIKASASDSDGSISKVRFFANGNLIGEDTGSPYQVTWNKPAVGEYKLTAQAIDNGGFSGVSNEIEVTITAEPQEPEVSLTDPDNNDIFNEGQDIVLKANASDSDGNVTKVEFFQGSTKLGEDTGSPYQFTWEDAPAGTYALTAKATDDDGLTETSSTVNISVRAKPTISFTSPADGETFMDGGTIQLVATAADVDGTVSKVEFFEGNTKLGEDTDTPYEFSWTNVPFGDYELRAVATDNNGLQGVAEIDIEVQIGPTISITSPTNGEVVIEGAPLTIEVATDDQDGTISKVEFYQGSSLLGEATTAPFSITTTDINAGGQTLTAIATDDDGLTANSAPVAISVKALPVVTITAPASGDNIIVGNDINISATANDPDGTVAKVEFYADAVKIGEVAAAPYTITWSQPVEGDYKIYAIATDNEDLQGTSDSVDFSVFTPPTILLTAPTDSAIFVEGLVINMNASAADTDGTIAAVSFYVENTLVGVDSIAPYEIGWINTDLGIGELEVYAIATDSDNLSTTSDTATIIVKGLPTILLTSPSDGQLLTEGDDILIETATADLDGEVSRVDFFFNGAPLGTDSVAPFTIDWLDIPSGVVVLTAIATDNDNLQRISTPITVTVRDRPNVTITNPGTGNTFIENEDVQIEASASDSDGTVSWVEFYYGSTFIGTDSTAPYSIFWMDVPGGTIDLVAVAYDNDSLAGVSDTTQIIIKSKPKGSFINPTLENGLTLGDNILKVDAQDPDGTIEKVEFFLDGVKLGEVTADPFEIDWPGAALGTYEVYAIITDNEGLTTTTEAFNFEVFPPSAITFFSANLTQSAEGANINWETQNEVRIASFIVERSLDRSFLEPTSIGTLPPVGSENELTAYSLLDPWTNMPNAEKLYYRVTALGFNGNTFFSDILLLQRGADFDIQIGPNPVVTGDNFRVTILGDADFIDIIDSNGRKIFSTTVPEFERVFTYPTSFLGRGWFAVRVRSSETEKVKKFIVINPQ